MSHGEETIRVPMELLDELLRSAGEMVINQTRLEMVEKEIENTFENRRVIEKKIVDGVKQVTLKAAEIAREFQKSVMEMRMVRMQETFSPFVRLVRDLARARNKNVNLIIEGGETMVDKMIAEEIKDPLLHLVRNSMDHGIEEPEEREKKGKNPQSTLRLIAEERDKQIFIKVIDDGRGIDPDKIRKKAVEKGLVSQREARELTDEEAWNYIFHPGFSTAEKVTDVSGRGVGMDVVKRNVEKLEGSISIESRVDEGTTITIRLPVLSAVNITDALLVEWGGDVYAAPLSSVVNTMKIERESLESVEGREAIVFRGETLFLYDPGELLKNTKRHVDYGGEVRVMVLKGKHGMLGMKVERLLSPQKIVIYQLDGLFKNVRGVAGATVLGAENLGLIFDVDDLVDLSQGRENEREILAREIQTARQKADEQSGGNQLKQRRLDLDVEIDPQSKVYLMDEWEGRLLDAYGKGLNIFEVKIGLQRDCAAHNVPPHSLFSILESVGDVLSVVPFSRALPDLEAFDPEGFDINIIFFVITAEREKGIREVLGMAAPSIRPVGVKVVEEDIEPIPAGGEVEEEEFEIIADVDDFILDTREHLERLNNGIVELEKSGPSEELVGEIFRSIHSVKGSSAMVGLKRLSSLLHHAENVLDRVRQGTIEITAEVVDILLETTRLIEETLAQIKLGKKPVLAMGSLMERLEAYVEIPKTEYALPADIAAEPFRPTSYESLVLDEKRAQGLNLYEILVEFQPDLPMKMVSAFLLFKELKGHGDIISTVPSMSLIDEGGFDLLFKMIFASSEEKERIEKVFSTPEVTRVGLKSYEGE